VSADPVVAAVPPPPVVSGLPRWAAPVFCAFGAVLVPWTLWLALSLPTRHISSHYDLAWSGFDVALAGALIATGIGLLRHAAWTQSAAAVAATLLICDAWFDVTLSAPGSEQSVALVTAMVAELPVAAACIVVARESEQMADRACSYVARMRAAGFGRRRSGGDAR
jgi:hypothetical protein